MTTVARQPTPVYELCQIQIFLHQALFCITSVVRLATMVKNSILYRLSSHCRIGHCFAYVLIVHKNSLTSLDCTPAVIKLYRRGVRISGRTLHILQARPIIQRLVRNVARMECAEYPLLNPVCRAYFHV
jgi:hypothetical protein